MQIKIINKQKLIDTVSERWDNAYKSRPINISCKSGLKDSNVIGDLLRHTPNLTEEKIEEIIENSTWTFLSCEHCQKQVNEVVNIQLEEDEVGICKPCFLSILEMFAG